MLAIPQSVADLAASVFATQGRVPLPSAVLVNTLLFALLRNKLLRVLTKGGFLSAFILGSGLWATLGWRGWTLCVLYLLFGSAVTKIKFQEKEEAGIAEARGGRRGPENVWGSALTGLTCAALATTTTSTIIPIAALSPELFTLAYVTSIATKLSDTFASEIGKAYGKTTFLITTWRRVPAGTEGAVSLEGTLAALVGASLLPLYALSTALLSSPHAASVATVSAFLATFAESWIGASVQGKPGFEWMTNEVVNFFNTLIGAGLSMVAGYLLLGL